MLLPVSVLHSILWVINIPVYGNTTFYLSIHQLMGIFGLFPLFGYYEQCCCEHLCANIYVDYAFTIHYANILVAWCELLTHWKSHWCWERLKEEGEEGFRGWDGWMASLMQWTWTWANFGRWQGTCGLVCWSPWGHRVGHDWATEQKRTTCL